jgi:hypothetical protein
METQLSSLPITVALRSTAQNVFASLNSGIVGSSPTRDIDVYQFLFCVGYMLYNEGSLHNNIREKNKIHKTVFTRQH